MTKTVRTYSVDHEISEKFKEQTPAKKTSQELEKLMADYINEDIEQQPDQPMFDISELTRKRKKLLQIIMEEKLFGKKYLTVKKKINSKHGIYERKDHFKQALRVLTKTLPIENNGDKIELETFECDNCGDKINLSEVADLNGSCLCDRMIIELP